jgi:hypothetical protein
LSSGRPTCPLSKPRWTPAAESDLDRFTRFASVSTDPDDIEARSLLAFSAAIGHHFIAADHGARSRGDVLDLAARRLFAAGST